MKNKEIISDNADDKDNNSSFILGFSFGSSIGSSIGLLVGKDISATPA